LRGIGPVANYSADSAARRLEDHDEKSTPKQTERHTLRFAPRAGRGLRSLAVTSGNQFLVPLQEKPTAGMIRLWAILLEGL